MGAIDYGSAWSVTLTKAAELGGLSRSTLIRRANEGRLKTVAVCGRRLVIVESLRALIGLDAQRAPK
jgi:predicted site-specific integrase-resolvase